MSATQKNAKSQKFQKIAQIGIKYEKYHELERTRIKTSMDTYNIFMEVWDMDTFDYQESLWMIFLDRGNFVLGVSQVSIGSCAGTIVDPKSVFGRALLVHASYILLAHNHPSGNLNPSQADIDITRKLTEGGNLLEIKVLDHLILTRKSYYSFADEGMMNY